MLFQKLYRLDNDLVPFSPPLTFCPPFFDLFLSFTLIVSAKNYNRNFSTTKHITTHSVCSHLVLLAYKKLLMKKPQKYRQEWSKTPSKPPHSRTTPTEVPELPFKMSLTDHRDLQISQSEKFLFIPTKTSLKIVLQQISGLSMFALRTCFCEDSFIIQWVLGLVVLFFLSTKVLTFPLFGLIILSSCIAIFHFCLLSFFFLGRRIKQAKWIKWNGQRNGMDDVKWVKKETLLLCELFWFVMSPLTPTAST